MADLIKFPGVSRLNTDPALELQEAMKVEDLESVVIMGFKKDGSEYFRSSIADGGSVMWLMRLCEHKLLRHALNQDDHH